MRTYRLFLLLYPAAFRAQYDDELSSLFYLRLREASSPLARLWLWFETIADILLSSLQAHFDILRQDLAYTTRVLRRSSAFTITAILVAALGIGATTAVYTITDYALLRPLPYRDAGRLVKLWENMSGTYSQMEPSSANYRDWKRMSRSFSAMAALRDTSVSMTGIGDPQQVEGSAVTSDLLPMLGVQPLIGRAFTEKDDSTGAAGTLLLSHRMWMGRFGGDPNVLGRKVALDGESYTVIGVMPEDFGYPRPEVELLTPMRFQDSDFADRNNNYLRVVAKLAPGRTVDQAASEMQLISGRLRAMYPKDNEHVNVAIHPLRDEISPRSRLLLWILLGASVCVLLIACTNLANLLLARALDRRKELALRKALGAGRERLVRQLLTESIVLAACGGTTGVLLATAAVPFLSNLVPSALPLATKPEIDGRVILFALAVTIVTGLLFGVVPSIGAANASATDGLQEGARQGIGGRKQGLRSGLVIAQVALSIVLLVASGLLMRALVRLQETDPGFRAAGVLTMRTSLPMPRYEKTALRGQFYSHVLSQIQALPGVSSAGYTSFLPIVFQGGIWPVTIAGQPPNTDRAFHQASLRFVTPGYLETMQIPLLEGRRIANSDSSHSQYVAVVSDSFAKEYWPHENSLGHQFDFGFAGRTVVGIVGDVRVRGVEWPSEPQVYLPSDQVPDGYLNWYAPKDLVVRSTLLENQLVPAIRRIVAQADSQQPVSNIATLTEVVGSNTASRRLQLRILTGFTAIALILAAIGINGLLSFTVSRRTQEIGVRVAVGAKSKDIVFMILSQSLSLALAGVAVGVVAAYTVAKGLGATLVGVQPDDAVTYVAALALVVSVTLAGSVWPALRAVRVDPITAIRAE